MRSCQLCGCASWGPVKDPTALEEEPVAHWIAEDKLKLLECDGCGSLAREDLIAESSVARGTSVLGGPFAHIGEAPPFMSGALAAKSMFSGLVQDRAPETRMERLVRAFMCPWGMPENTSIPHVARTMVKLAREVEIELDAVIEGSQVHRTLPDLKPRDFNTDFLYPALSGIASEHVRQVSVALDCAIAYGALEGQTTNQSLKLSAELEGMYWSKVEQLKKLVY